MRGEVVAERDGVIHRRIAGRIDQSYTGVLVQQASQFIDGGVVIEF
jgi:hypothetical protein